MKDIKYIKLSSILATINPNVVSTLGEARVLRTALTAWKALGLHHQFIDVVCSVDVEGHKGVINHPFDRISYVGVHKNEGSFWQYYPVYFGENESRVSLYQVLAMHPINPDAMCYELHNAGQNREALIRCTKPECAKYYTIDKDLKIITTDIEKCELVIIGESMMSEDCEFYIPDNADLMEGLKNYVYGEYFHGKTISGDTNSFGLYREHMQVSANYLSNAKASITILTTDWSRHASSFRRVFKNNWK